MPRTLTAAESAEFLARPQVGVLSVADEAGDRPPLTVPVWYAYQPGGELTFFTGTQGRTARKTRLLERAGKLSFCVQQGEYPYKYVTVECTITKADRAPAMEQVLEVTSRFLPADVAKGFAEAETSNPTGTFVLFTARPDRWLSVDFADYDQHDDQHDD